MVANLSIPYALHRTRGRISPTDEQDGVGRKANVSCLGCNEELEHRRASRNGRRAHYAHRAGSQAEVSSCRETAIHLRAKDLLASVKYQVVTLPPWYTGQCDVLPTIQVADGTTEHRIGERWVDVLWLNEQIQQLAIEVHRSNRKDEDYATDVRQWGLAVIELTVTDEDDAVDVEELLERLRESEWVSKPAEPFHSDDPSQSRLPTSYLESRHRHLQRVMVVDSAVAEMSRNAGAVSPLRPWYMGKYQTPMPPKTQRRVFANAIILSELGFVQTNPTKPWLFIYSIHKQARVILYADLGGSDVVPIHEDTAAMLYVFGQGLDDDFEEKYYSLVHHTADPIKQYIIDKFGEQLQHFGVDVRTGFRSPEHVQRKGVNPLSHVSTALLEPMIKDFGRQAKGRESREQSAAVGARGVRGLPPTVEMSLATSSAGATQGGRYTPSQDDVVFRVDLCQGVCCEHCCIGINGCNSRGKCCRACVCVGGQAARG